MQFYNPYQYNTPQQLRRWLSKLVKYVCLLPSVAINRTKSLLGSGICAVRFLTLKMLDCKCHIFILLNSNSNLMSDSTEMWSDRVTLVTASRAKNPFSLSIPGGLTAYYEYFQVSIESLSHNNDNLTWKLIDKAGCEQDLPYFFKKGELDVIKITIHGYQDDASHNFACFMKCWKKELQKPIAKYYSISTVEIVPKEKCAIPPICRSRKRGVNDWTYGSLVTFDNTHVPHECQLYYVLPKGIIVKSPRFEVKCMWDKFNIRGECFNYEEIVLDNKFNLKLSKRSAHNIEYTATLRLTEPTTHEDYNKEQLIKSSTQSNLDRPNFALMPNAQYKFKIYIEKPKVAYSKVFTVPSVQPVDQILWTKHFGQVDHVLFGLRQAERGINWINYWTGEGIELDTKINVFRLTLYRNGKYFFKSTYQADDEAEITTKYACGGSFTLSALNSANLQVWITKLFKNTSLYSPITEISPVNPQNLEQTPEALWCADIIRLIWYYSTNWQRRSFRSVCKMWRIATPTAREYVLVQNTIDFFGVNLTLQETDQLDVAKPKVHHEDFHHLQ